MKWASINTTLFAVENEHVGFKENYIFFKKGQIGNWLPPELDLRTNLSRYNLVKQKNTF